MPEELKTKLELFTDTGAERIAQYKKLARAAYNNNPVPADFDDVLKNGLRKTKRLTEAAKKTDVLVSRLIKRNLTDRPITYALIDEKNGAIVGVGCLKNHEYILFRARQSGNKALVQEILSDPPSWGCLEYICIDHPYRNQQVGRSLIKSLLAEADALGLKTKALYCAETEVGFYEKMGFRVAGFADDGYVLRIDGPKKTGSSAQYL